MPIAGFLPIGLAYHAALSLVAALFWVVVTHRTWPADEDAEQHEQRRPAGHGLAGHSLPLPLIGYLALLVA